MDNPYEAPATTPERIDPQAPVLFKAGHVAAVTFFGTGIVGGICLCIAEWKNHRRGIAVALLMTGILLAIGSFLFRLQPAPIKFLGFPYNIFVAFIAYKYVTSRISALGGPSTIRFLSGWWAFLVWSLYLMFVVGVILMVATSATPR